MEKSNQRDRRSHGGCQIISFPGTVRPTLPPHVEAEPPAPPPCPDFASISPSGDFQLDWQTGEDFAVACLRYIEAEAHDWGEELLMVIRRKIREAVNRYDNDELGVGVSIGFLNIISRIVCSAVEKQFISPDAVETILQQERTSAAKRLADHAREEREKRSKNARKAAKARWAKVKAAQHTEA